jgi:uncharacterized C2H2 Zn-finger protein
MYIKIRRSPYNIMKIQSRYISDKNKKIILERQNYKCANKPDVDLFRIGDFPCLLWEGTRNGVFIDSLYEIDHIIEFSLTSDNSVENLQALCSSCHCFKTKSFQAELSLARQKGVIGDYKTKQKSFMCENCGLQFESQSTYINHMKRKPYCANKIHGDIGKYRNETNIENKDKNNAQIGDETVTVNYNNKSNINKSIKNANNVSNDDDTIEETSDDNSVDNFSHIETSDNNSVDNFSDIETSDDNSVDNFSDIEDATSNDTKSFICKKCGLSFDSWTIFNRHMNRKTDCSK